MKKNQTQLIGQPKQHYKMYKAKKVWLYTAITTFGFVAALSTTDVQAQADAGDTSIPTTQTSPSDPSSGTTENGNSATLNTPTSGSTGSTSTADEASKAAPASTEENSPATTATEEGPVYTDKDEYNAAMDTYNQEYDDYQTKLNAKDDAETENQQINQENANIAQQNSDAIQNYHVDENVYQQKLTAYQTALDQYNADTQTNAATVDDYAQQIADYQDQLAQYQQAERDWQETTNTINAQNTANDARYQAELTDYNEAMTRYNSELQAVKDATDARLATAASNAEKVAIYAAAIGEYTTAKKDYETKLANYNDAVAAQQVVINHNQQLDDDYTAALNDYNSKMADYLAAKAAYDEAVQSKNTVENNNAQAQADYQLKYNDYIQALHVFNAAKVTYDQDKATYDASEALYQTAVTKENDAQDAVNQANTNSDDVAAASQALADLLSEPKPADTNWQAAVQTAFSNLTDLATAANGALEDLQDKVTAYQAALDNVTSPEQPDALTTGPTVAELADYAQDVNHLQQTLADTQLTVSQHKATYEAGTAVNASSAVLTTAAQTLNEKLAAINTAIAAKDTTNMADALNDAITAKQAYNTALADYNTAVQNYRTLDSTAMITTITAPDESEWTTLEQAVNAQSELNDAYGAAKTAYDAMQPAFTAMQTDVSEFNQAITAYNDLINTQKAALDADPTLSIDTLIAQQADAATAVTEAQAKLKAALTPGLEGQLQAYVTAATTYQQAGGSSLVDLNALTTVKSQLNELKAAVDQDLTATISNNKLALANPGLAYIYGELQDRVNNVNVAAKAQAEAADAWNNKVAEAQADGRWALFFNGDDGLLALANRLTQANAAYADALNNTTTTFKAETITDPDTGKSFNLTVTDATTENATSSLTELVDQYQTAATQYNATHAQKLPDASAVLSGVDVAKLSTEFSSDSTQLMSAITDMLTKVGKLAADEKQNAIVTDRLDSKSENFTGTTDGSDEPLPTANSDPSQLTANIITMKNATDYTNLALHNFPNATDSGNYATTLAIGAMDYDTNVTAPNGVVKTPFYDQEDVLDRLLAQTYTDTGTLVALRGTGKPAPASATLYGLPDTFELDGVTYYLAAYSYIAQGNETGTITSTTQVYTFTNTDPKEEFKQIPLVIASNKMDNTRLNFYFMPVNALPATFDVTADVVTPLQLSPVVPEGELVTLDEATTPGSAPTPTPFQPTEVQLPNYQTGEEVTPQFEVVKPNISQLPKLALNSPLAPSNPGESPQEPNAPTPPTLEEVPTVPEAPTEPEKPELPPHDDVPNLPDKPTPPQEPAKPELDKSPNIPKMPTKPTPPTSSPDTPLPPEPVKPVQPTPPDLIKTNKPKAPVPPTLTLLPPVPYTTVPGTPVPPIKPRYEEPNEPNEPNNPDTPGEPNTPETPNTPKVPNEPVTPETPTEPTVPNTPQPSMPMEPNTPNEPNEPSKPVTPETENNEIVSSVQNSTKEVETPVTQASHTTLQSNKVDANQLPQTSENNANSSAIIGLGLLGSLLGLVGIKKRREE